MVVPKEAMYPKKRIAATRRSWLEGRGFVSRCRHDFFSCKSVTTPGQNQNTLGLEVVGKRPVEGSHAYKQ